MDSNYSVSRRQFVQSAAAIATGVGIAWRPAFSAESDLIVRSADPNNAEPPLTALAGDRITPVKHFYIRNHGPMPKVDGNSHRVRIDGLVQRPLELSLVEIKQRFRPVTTEATLTCAG